MTQELASQRFCTITHYVQLSVDSVLVLHVHALPESEDEALRSSPPSGPSTSLCLPPPFSWLAERHMQEVLVMVHEVVGEKAVRGLSGPTLPAPSKKTAAAGATDLQLKRGCSVRALFSFKTHNVTQHIVLPTDPSLSPLLSSSAGTFLNGQGRLVFESTGVSTSGGWYRPFRAVQDSLHVFVDQYEPTSHKGVIKVMMLLDPSQKKMMDVLTYFLPTSKPRGASGSGGEGEGVLGDLPLEGLKRRRGGGRRGGRGRERPARGKNGSKKKVTSQAGVRETRVTAGFRHSTKQTRDSSSTANHLTRPAVRERGSSSTIDELGSEWLSGGEEGETQEKTGDCEVSGSPVVISGSGDKHSPTTPAVSDAASGETTGSGRVGSPIPLSPTSYASFATPPHHVEWTDEVEMEGLWEKMDVDASRSGGGVAAVGGGQSPREMSPDLWSPEGEPASPPLSQPLEDITNSITASPQSRKKTLSPSTAPRTAAEECCSGTPEDEEGEVGVIVMVSDDEESSVSQSTSSQPPGEAKAGRERKGKKRKIVSPETLFRGAKELRDVPRRSVSRWLAQQKELLVDIFHRRVFSRRHESFVIGARGRAVLLHQISHHLFTKEQRDALTAGLMHAFCHKNMNLFSYVMSVLYPECLIRLIMDYHSISFEQAERKMMGLDEIDIEL